MAGRGPYQVTLSTAPTQISQDDTGQYAASGTAFTFVCWEADWRFGYADMTASNGATPGAVIKAGASLPIQLEAGDAKVYACVDSGTATLQRIPAGI